MSFKYHRSYIIALVTLHEAYKLWSSSSCNYLHSLLIQSLPCPNISVLTSPNYRIFDILASYSGDFGFCSRSGGRLSWWGISWFLLSPSRQTVGHYIKVGPDHFLSYPFQFIVRSNSSVRCHITCAFEKATLNNVRTSHSFCHTSFDVKLIRGSRTTHSTLLHSLSAVRQMQFIKMNLLRAVPRTFKHKASSIGQIIKTIGQ